MTAEQTFEEAVAEFTEKTREYLDTESTEGIPPNAPAPYVQEGPPFESPIRLDSRFIAKYARAIGDDNPIYTDPEYGKRTRYGCQLAPGPVLNYIRYPGIHGATRPQGYPVANFVAGAAWEFFDVLRVGTRFRTSKTTKELIEKKGAQGDLLFLISEVNYWDYHGELPAKCYGTLIMVPQRTMGTSRAMEVERLGEHMLYERKASNYNAEQIEETISQIEGWKRRGAETLYWEDVQVGDKLGPMILPPWSLQDQMCQDTVNSHTVGTGQNPGDTPITELEVLSFETSYKLMRQRPGSARTHPNTRWPWTPGAEHEDALLAAFRGQPGPFDHGGQRFQIPQQLMTNWIGDNGFIRRMYSALRRPVYYADVTTYTGEVVKKFTEVQKGDDGPGGTPGEATYYAVGISWRGANQVGEAQVPGTATVYLPSREGGPVQLPIPHPANPPFVGYETFRKDWY